MEMTSIFFQRGVLLRVLTRHGATRGVARGAL